MAEYILIVDDQFPVRYMLQTVLWESGYRAQCATNGWECLKMARSVDKPALIVLDCQMPEMTGIEVISMLKKGSITREIPVIIISATEDLKEIAKSRGAHTVLTKPLDLKALLEAVQNVLA
ncbi:MAG: response regulator [Dehalobacterium sp.]